MDASKYLLPRQILKNFASIFVGFTSMLPLSNKLYSQTIDLSKPVGSPKGMSSPNGLGGITYTIPITILPGVNSSQPNISLNYSSQGGDGIAGWGWGLSAFSSITRAGKTNYYNGITKPVAYNNTEDAFLLDGQHLFPTSGDNGSNGTIYGTENEGFSKVESFGGTAITGPDWFKVTTKDGKVLEYGHVSNTKLLTDNGASNMIWLLNRITDNNGNYEDFHYNLNNTSRYFAISEIDYGYNTTSNTSTARGKILFSYTTKTNWQKTKVFQSGASITSPYLLNTISVVNSGGTTVKSYQCAYTTLDGQSFLQSVTEKGADGTSLNPLKFTYGANASAADVGVSPSYGQFNYNNTFTGDITGDGKDDIVAAYLHYDNNGIPHYNSYYVFDDFSTYNGQAALSIAYSYDMPDANNNSKADQVKSPGGYYNFLTSDYDGDTKKDVLMANWTISGADMIFNKITINYSRYYSSIQGTTYENKTYSSIPHSFPYANDFKYAYRNGSTFGTNFIPGDFDGDGAMDYILILGINSSNAFKAFFSSPSKGIFNEEIINFGVEGTSTDPFYANSVASATEVVPVDFDGDGKTEILVQKPSQSYILSVFPIPASSGYNYAAEVLYTTTSIKAGYRVFPGDFNGDRATDLLVRTSKFDANALWYVMYSTGKDLKSFYFPFQYRPYLDGDNPGYSTVHLIMIGDFNGDGRSDIWHSLDNATGGLHSEHVINFSNGIPLDGQNAKSGFTRQIYNRPESINKSLNTQSIVGDINGDGKPDLMSLLGTRSLIIYAKPFKEDHLLSSVTDGYAGVSTFSYGLMNTVYNYQRSSNYYYDASGTPIGQSQNGNPYNVLMSPMYLVSQITTPNGIGSSSYTSYSYKDAAFSPIRGFLGFKEVRKTNSSGISDVTISKINTTLLIPHAVRQLKLYGIDTITDVRITDTLRRLSTNYFDKRYVHEVNKTLSINGLTGAATESANTYDTYGNITSNTTKKGYLSGTAITPVETAITTTVYGTHGTPVPALPESVTVKNTRSGQSQVSKKSTFTYDAKGNALTSTEHAGTSLATTITNTYDSYGNIKTISVSAPSTPTPTITNTYDITGRFLTKKQSVGSNITKTETYTYDPKWGQIATAVSSDGLTTSYLYDNGYGRLIKTTSPDGNSITQTIAWETTGNARYSITSQRVADGGMYSKTYYDPLGRKIKTEQGGFNNQLLTAVTNYNYKGQVSSQTAPYYPSETPITTTNTYDNFDRPTGNSNGTSSVSISYSKLSAGKYKVTTTNGAGQADSKTQDAAGRIVTTNDNGGQLNFVYDSWGNQKTVTVGGNTLVSSVYDNYGRQTSLIDKNAGTITYEYNALGKVTKQTDALNHVYTVVYDAFGRVTSRTGPEGTVSYVYYKDGSGTKVNDNITKVTGFSGDVTNYVYDNLGRPTSQSVVYDGQTFTKSMVYDSYSNLVKTTYPSGVIINDTYDKNGALTKTTFGGNGSTARTLFTATAMNSRGVYTGYTYGNGKSSTVTFDLAKGAPSKYYTAGIQDLQLNFDGQTGNLLSRKDNIKNLTETFTFDNLNRLTGSKVNNVQQFTMSYDNSGGTSLGNIKSKSDIGNYVYDDNKINAVKYITSAVGGQTSPGVISHEQQDITYTGFLKAATISEDGYNLSYTYAQDQQRIKSVLKQGSTVLETKYYLGAFERQIKGDTTRDIVYVNAGNGLCAIIVKQGTSVTPYFVYSDHLGSILKITDTLGNMVAQQNFDSWGRNRNPNNWTYSGIPAVPTWLYRGYTGHEHMARFVLINMNGRIYDPVTGRMLSPDNYVPLPWNTQGYNGYGYAGNNPLLYIDADGNFFWLAIPLIAGAIINVADNWGSVKTAFNHGFWNGIGHVASYAGIGAVNVAANIYLPPVVGATVGALVQTIGDGLTTGDSFERILEDVTTNVGISGVSASLLFPGSAKIINNIGGKLTSKIANTVVRETVDDMINSFASTTLVSGAFSLSFDAVDGGKFNLWGGLKRAALDGLSAAVISGSTTLAKGMNARQELARAAQERRNTPLPELAPIANTPMAPLPNQVSSLPDGTQAVKINPSYLEPRVPNSPSRAPTLPHHSPNKYKIIINSPTIKYFKR